MIAFEVFLNGKRLSLAGSIDASVITAIVTARGGLGKKSTLPMSAGQWPTELSLSVLGMASKSERRPSRLLDWVDNAPLGQGDEIRIVIKEVSKVSRPKRTRPARSPGDERKEFEWAKERYNELRPKFESTAIKKPRVKRGEGKR